MRTIWKTYLIISKKINKYTSYVGYTKNVKKRVELHNKSKGKFNLPEVKIGF